MSRLLTIILILFSSNFIYAKQIKAIKADTPSDSKQFNNASIPKDELEAYKLLYLTSQKSYESQKDNIYWILGLLVTFIVLILSSQYIFNWRLNKEEIARIRSDIEVKFQTELLASKEEYNLRTKEILEEIGVKHSEQLSLYQSLIIDNAEKYTEYKVDIKENIALNNEIIKKDIHAIKISLESQISRIDIAVENITGYVWSLRGVEMNALRRFIGVMEMNIEKNLNLKYSIDDIINSLKKIMDLDFVLYEELTQLIAKSRKENPNKYTDEFKQIEQLCQNKRLYKHTFDGKGSVTYMDNNPFPTV